MFDASETAGCSKNSDPPVAGLQSGKARKKAQKKGDEDRG